MRLTRRSSVPGAAEAAIRLAREVTRERSSHRASIVQIDDMPSNKAAEVVCVDAARQIVSSRNRAKGARVVVEAGGVVDASRLRRLLAEADHSFDGIVEPPRRSEAHCWVVTCNRSELAGICRLVQREHHERKTRIVSVRVQERRQISRVFGAGREMSPPVSGPKRSTTARLLIAE